MFVTVSCLIKHKEGIKMQGFRHPGCITCEHPEYLNRFYLQI